MYNPKPHLSELKQTQAIYIFADLRGFTNWSKTYQLDVGRLISIAYEYAYNYFGEPKDQKYLKRVVKFLGDGFFAVQEYTDKTFKEKYIETLNDCIEFVRVFNETIKGNMFHDCEELKFGFGISFGTSERFNIKGMPFDYIGERVNLSSRLCSKSNGDEIIVESDLSQYTRELLEERKFEIDISEDKIDLKGIGCTGVVRIKIASELGE